VTSEVPQLFWLSSGLRLQRFALLCSLLSLRLLGFGPWPRVFENPREAFVQVGTWIGLRFSAFFQALQVAVALNFGYEILGFAAASFGFLLADLLRSALFYFSRRRRRRRLLSTSFTQQVPSVHGFKVLLPADLGEGDLLAVFFVAALWFRVLSLHRAAAEELPPPTT